MGEREPQIVAFGGGGFSMEAGNPLLDDYVMDQTGAARPKVCFLPTASGDADHYIVRFYRHFGSRAQASHVSLFRRGAERDVAGHLLEQDLIYVGGGSMRNLLAIWQAHGLDATFREAWERGIVLAGHSAGAMCWFEAGVTRSGGPPEPIAGLGMLPGSFSVHADTEPERLPVYRDAVRAGAVPAGWAADDGVGLLFRGRTLDRIVGARAGATARRVDPEGEWTLVAEVPAACSAPVDEDVRELRRVARVREAHGARPWR